MEIKIVNEDVYPFYIVYQNNSITLLPKTSCSLTFSDEVIFKLKHMKPDKNNSVLYLLTAFVSYEQSRIELIVDGEYKFKPKEREQILKIKSREYVFNKKVSYDTFVFNCNSGSISCTHYFIPDKDNILKKCRFLYLFGGIKSIFPMCIIVFLVSLLCSLFNNNMLDNISLTIGSGITAMIFAVSYIRSLRFLRESCKEDKIRAYMDSKRIEYRTYEDNVVQSYLDGGSDKEEYQ